MNKVFLLGIGLCWLLSGTAQTGVVNPTFENVVPPSPSAAAITKFGSIPVGQSTGIPSISIPVYNYANKGLGMHLGISLEYHAGGIRVNEKASNVGLGWSLNAGGAITRVVRGIPDEISGGLGFLTEGPLALETSDANVSPNWFDRLAAHYFYHLIDYQSDLFSYNFNGHSGQFTFGRNHDILFMPQTRIKVAYTIDSVNTSGSITSFTILDEMGYKYVFSDYETTNNDGSTEQGHIYNSAWYLSKIVTPAGKDSITFSYNTISLPSNMVGRTTTITVPIAGNNPAGTSGAFSSTTTSAKQLASIHFPNGATANFDYDPNERTDLQGDHWLQKISISDGISPTQGVQLAHDYSLNRSTLTSVTPFGGTDQLPPYTMTYENPLPAHALNEVSDAIDHWGFYNGNQGDLIPFEIFPHGIQGPTQSIVYTLPGGNRNTDPDKVKAGSLTKITYPTGGYTTFEMEANQAVDQWLSQRDTVFQSFDSSIDYRKPILHLADTDPFGSDTVNFVYDAPSNNEVDFTINIPGDFAASCPSGNCQIIAEVHNSTNQIIQTNSWTFDPNGGSISFKLIDPPTGSYQVVVYCGTGLTDFDVNLDVEWTIFYGQYTRQVIYNNIQPYVGGLRVKKISDYSPESANPVQTREYEYLQADGVTSSGALGAFPVYSYEVWYMSRSDDIFKAPDFRDLYAPGTSTNYVIRSSSTINDIAYVNGSPVTYQRVTEKLLNNGASNGRIVREFTSFTEQPPAILQVFPFVPPLFYSWMYGLLKKEQVFDANNNLLKETDNEFNYPTDGYFNDSVRKENFRCLSIAPVIFEWEDPDPLKTTSSPNINSQPLYWLVSSFYPFAGRAELVKSTSTEYSTAGTLVRVDSTEYDPSFFYVKRKIAYDSKDQAEIHTLSYPNDQVVAGSDPTGVYQQMVDHNILSVPISDSLTRGTHPISFNKATYFNPSGTVFAPQKIDVQVADNAPETRLTYNAYDIHGNAISATGSDGIQLSFVYDYNNQFPIAQVKNADSASIAYTSFEADGTGNWTIGSSSRDATTAITGRKSYTLSSDISKSGLSSGATYYVTYWTQNTGPFSITGTISGYPQRGKTINGWTLYTHKVTGQTTISLSGSGHIDELRLYPVTAQMTTYTYDPLIGLTSQADAGNRITYYEYDALSRLKRIRDQDHNILKSYDYQYQQPSGCGSNCTILTMQTLAGTNTLSYPVGVFDIHGVLLGNATNQAAYVTLWNNDTANSRIGTLSAGADSMHFQLALNSGQQAPAGVTGCRYFQVDLTGNRLDGVRNFNAAYIDFGDNTGMYMGHGHADTPAVIAPFTTYVIIGGASGDTGLAAQAYFTHTYADTLLKIITCYHNDQSECEDFDNAHAAPTGLPRLTNLRGNLPANTHTIGGSCYQQPSMTSIANIYNWNKLQGIQFFRLNNGDGVSPCEQIGYPADFLQNSPGLLSIQTTWTFRRPGVVDSTFKITRLKSDWNTYFTQLKTLKIEEKDWNHEDLSALHHLNFFGLAATPQDPQNYASSPIVPIDPGVIDNIIIQIAAATAGTVRNGTLGIFTGGTTRTSLSDAAYNQLINNGWVINFDTRQ